MAELATHRITVEEYLRREEISETRNEYFDGEIFAMAGTSADHSRIAVNLGRILSTALRGGSCESFESNMRVRVEETGLYTYPDLSIACDPEFDASKLDTLLNPLVVIEILSPSTENYDRGAKFDHYERVSTIMEIWFVAQDRRWVERNRRIGPRQWLKEVFTEGEVLCEAAKVAVPLDELYERVQLPPAPPLR